MFCGNCGTPLEKDQNVCPSCGTVTGVGNQQPPVVEQEPVVPVQEEIVAPVQEEIPVAEIPAAEPVAEEAPADWAPAFEPIMQNSLDPEAPAVEPVTQNSLDPEAPAVQPPQIEIPTVEIPVGPGFTVGTGAPTPKKPKKAKKWILPVAIVTLVLAVIGTCTAVFWPYITAWFDRTVSTPEKNLQNAQSSSTGEGSAVDVAGNVYGEILGILKGEMSNSARASVTFRASDEFTSFVETFWLRQGAEIDVDWLDSLSMSLDIGAKGSDLGAALALGLNDTDLITGELFINLLEGKLFMGVPELQEEFVSLDVAQYLKDNPQVMDSFVKALMDSKDKSNKLAESLPTEAEMEALLRKYIDLAMDQIQEVERTTETVRLEELSQKFTILTFEVTPEDLMDIALVLLKEAEKDETVIQIVEAVCEYNNTLIDEVFEGTGEDPKEYYLDPDEIMDSIGDAIDQLEDYDSGNDDPVIIRTYVDMKNQICGRTIENEDEDILLSYVTVREGDEWEFQLIFQEDQVEITGIGTEKKEMITGEYSLEIKREDQKIELLTLEVENFDQKAKAEGKIRGTFRIAPGKYLLEQVLDEMPEYLTSLLGVVAPKLELKLEDNSVALNLLVSGKFFAGVDVKLEMNTGYTPEKPEKSVDMETTDAEEWRGKITFDKLIENLRKAKVPAEYVDALEELINQGLGFGETLAA